MSFEDFLIIFLVGPLPLLVFAMCCWRAVTIVVRRTPQNARGLARRMTTIQVPVGVIAGLISLGGMIGCFLSVMNGGLHDGTAPAIGAYAAFGLLLALALIPLARIKSALRVMTDSDPTSVQLDIDSEAGKLEFAGWMTLCLALIVTVVMMSFGLLLLLVFGLGVIPVLFWQRRRDREGQLLWLLAISARNNSDLAEDLEAHAQGWTGAHAVRLRQLAVYLRAGRPLGVALSQVSALLPRWVISSIQIGDETGTLKAVLAECATAHMSWLRQRFRTGSITGLLIYIVTYLWATVGLVSFQMYFIVPKYKAIFEGFGTELPWLTETLIHASDVAAPFVMLGTPLAMIVALIMLRCDHLGWRNVRWRVFGRLYPRFDGAPILRHLARVIEKGAALPDGLLAIANRYHRPSVCQALAAVYVDTEAGGDCWTALLRKGFLSRRDVALIEAAQRNNNLPWALRELADVREQRYIFHIDSLAQILRPIVVFTVGITVGWICIAMFLPTAKLVNDLS